MINFEATGKISFFQQFNANSGFKRNLQLQQWSIFVFGLVR